MTGLGRIKGVLTGLTGVASRASNQIVLLFITVVATRYLVPAQFGVFSIAAACITLVRTLLYSGAFEYLLKAQDPRKCSTECLVVNIAAATTLSGILVIVAIFSNVLFGSFELGSVLLYMLPSNFISTATAWQEALLLRGGRIKLYYVLTFLTEIVSGAVAIVLFNLHWGLGALIVQTYVRTIFMGVAYLFIERPILSDRFSASETWHVFHWALSRYIGVFVSFAYVYGADFILSAFFSTAAAGLYRASDRIVTAVSDVFAQPTRTFSVILFSKRVATDRDCDDLWPKILTASASVGWPALAGLATVAGPLVPLILGPKWTAAAPLVSIICLLKSFSLITSVITALLVAHNWQRTVLGVQIVASLATILGLVIFARYGVAAAAWSITAVAAGAILWQVVFVITVFPKSWIPVRQSFLTMLVPTIATALGAQLCLRYAPALANSDKWTLTVFVIGGGVLAWLCAALPFRGQIIRSIEALGGD